MHDVPRKGWRCLLLIRRSSDVGRSRPWSMGGPAARVATELEIAESGLRRWVDRHLAEAGRKPGLTGHWRDELVRLRRENRVLRMERDLLSRAAAFFAMENFLSRK